MKKLFTLFIITLFCMTLHAQHVEIYANKTYPGGYKTEYVYTNDIELSIEEHSAIMSEKFAKTLFKQKFFEKTDTIMVLVFFKDKFFRETAYTRPDESLIEFEDPTYLY